MLGFARSRGSASDLVRYCRGWATGRVEQRRVCVSLIGRHAALARCANRGHHGAYAIADVDVEFFDGDGCPLPELGAT